MVNWLKIIANSGYVFFLMMTGFVTAEKMFNLEVSLSEYLMVCSLIAFFNTMLVFFIELKKEAERKPRKKIPEKNKPDDKTDNDKQKSNLEMIFMIF